MRCEKLLGPFYGAIAVSSVTRCRCCRRRRCCCGHRCADGVRQWRRATVATPGEWQYKAGGVRRLAVVNGPNIFQMLLVCISGFMDDIMFSNSGPYGVLCTRILLDLCLVLVI